MGLDVPIPVNVSPKQFHCRDFAEGARRVVAEVVANPRRPIFQITEGFFPEDLTGTISRRTLLAAMGIRFSIDGSGTGYSSLAYF